MISYNVIFMYQIILLLTIILTIVNGQASFNIYKAYDKASVRPAQYSSNRKKMSHPINEYLTPQQMEMAALRKSSTDNPNDVWNPATLNGFNQYKQFQARNAIPAAASSSNAAKASNNRRNLISLDIVEEDVFDFQYNPLKLGLGFIGVSVLLTVIGVTFYKLRKPKQASSTFSV